MQNTISNLPSNNNVLPALGSEEEMEYFIDQLIAASDIRDAKAKKLSGTGTHEASLAEGSSN